MWSWPCSRACRVKSLAPRQPIARLAPTSSGLHGRRATPAIGQAQPPRQVELGELLLPVTDHRIKAPQWLRPSRRWRRGYDGGDNSSSKDSSEAPAKRSAAAHRRRTAKGARHAVFDAQQHTAAPGAGHPGGAPPGSGPRVPAGLPALAAAAAAAAAPIEQHQQTTPDVHALLARLLSVLPTPAAAAQGRGGGPGWEVAAAPPADARIAQLVFGREAATLAAAAPLHNATVPRPEPGGAAHDGGQAASLAAEVLQAAAGGALTAAMYECVTAGMWVGLAYRDGHFWGSLLRAAQPSLPSFDVRQVRACGLGKHSLRGGGERYGRALPSPSKMQSSRPRCWLPPPAADGQA